MKFIIKKNDILPVLSKIQGLTGRKSNLAITSNILIKAEGSNIRLTVTDLETGYEGIYPAKVEEEGSIVINAKKIYEIIKEFPDENIFFNEIKPSWIKISQYHIEKSIVEYQIVGMNSDEFPEIPQIKDVLFFGMEAESLKTMIERSLIIGFSDDKRAHIIGVYFERPENDKNCLRMVSTDGNRLSLVDYKKNKDLPEVPGIIIPKKGLAEIAKFLDNEGIVQIGIQNNNFITTLFKYIVA